MNISCNREISTTFPSICLGKEQKYSIRNSCKHPLVLQTQTLHAGRRAGTAAWLGSDIWGSVPRLFLAGAPGPQGSSGKGSTQKSSDSGLQGQSFTFTSFLHLIHQSCSFWHTLPTSRTKRGFTLPRTDSPKVWGTQPDFPTWQAGSKRHRRAARGGVSAGGSVTVPALLLPAPAADTARRMGNPIF